MDHRGKKITDNDRPNVSNPIDHGWIKEKSFLKKAINVENLIKNSAISSATTR